MTDQSTPAKRSPWLWIAIGAVILCLCAVAIGVAGFAFFLPGRSVSVATEQPILVEATPETSQPADVTPQEDENPLTSDAAPVGTAVDIGNNMTLTILDVTRPADEIVANGNSFNTTAREGEEFIQVKVNVTCGNDAGSPCTFYPTVMKVLLSDGSARDLQTFIEGVDDWDTSVEIDGGETQQGILLFIVPRSETRLVVSYQDIYADQPLYLQLP